MAFQYCQYLFAVYLLVALSSLNISASDQVENSFSPALATFYGDPNGAGSNGGACGYGTGVEKPPFSAMVSAGNDNIFKSGKGCGACYQVKCTENPACSGVPVTVTITDECPGVCFNSSPVHFDLSGTVFGAMAVAGQADALRGAGVINIEHKRVPCFYSGTTLAIKVDTGSNPNYFAGVIEYVPGDGSLSSVRLLPANLENWLTMEQSWGATWKIELPSGAQAPFSISITMLESNSTLMVMNMVPMGWVLGKTYYSPAG